MKLVLFTGDHSRHLFVNQTITDLFDDALIIVMKREEIIPPFSFDTDKNHLKELYTRHFQTRLETETAAYGHLKVDDIFKNFRRLHVQPSELNSSLVASEVRKFDPDFCFIFGTDIIKDPVLSELPPNKVNLHLGLSPWYRGSATLFWPFYELKPQYCGITFHQIVPKADAGALIHQARPALQFGHGIHDVGVNCVKEARRCVKPLIDLWKTSGSFSTQEQRSTGRLWRGVDFHPSQLRVIYELFNDDLVDHYLNGQLSTTTPRLFKAF